MTLVGAVDDYFSTLDATTRAAFEHIRHLVMDVAPAAEQGTSYGTPPEAREPPAARIPRRQDVVRDLVRFRIAEIERP